MNISILDNAVNLFFQASNSDLLITLMSIPIILAIYMALVRPFDV